MRASTTIKKNAVVNRKKAKQARELENIKRMIDSENELNTEERATSEYYFSLSIIQNDDYLNERNKIIFVLIKFYALFKNLPNHIYKNYIQHLNHRIPRHLRRLLNYFSNIARNLIIFYKRKMKMN